MDGATTRGKQRVIWRVYLSDLVSIGNFLSTRDPSMLQRVFLPKQTRADIMPSIWLSFLCFYCSSLRNSHSVRIISTG